MPMVLLLALYAIQRAGPLRTATVATEIGCTPRHARRMLGKLEVWGVLERYGTGEYTRWRPVGLDALMARIRRGGAS